MNRVLVYGYAPANLRQQAEQAIQGLLQSPSMDNAPFFSVPLRSIQGSLEPVAYGFCSTLSREWEPQIGLIAQAFPGAGTQVCEVESHTHDRWLNWLAANSLEPIPTPLGV